VAEADRRTVYGCYALFLFSPGPRASPTVLRHGSTAPICGDHDFCTPSHLSKEIAAAIPRAEFILLRDAAI
jgi:hypothetical protein